MVQVGSVPAAHLGTFKYEEDAAQAYDRAIINHSLRRERIFGHVGDDDEEKAREVEEPPEPEDEPVEKEDEDAVVAECTICTTDLAEGATGTMNCCGQRLHEDCQAQWIS